MQAPVGGWNTKDPISNMAAQYATIMDNWLPQTNDIRVRKGYSQHVTGLDSTIETLMVYNKPDGTTTIFAAEGTDFFNVTSAGAVGAAVQSSLTNARWYYTNFTNSSGTSYLCCFNGADSPRYWNGSAWTTITGASSPAITGVTTSNLIFPFIHKRRMFLIEKDTLKLWYLPIDAVGGAANALDLSGIASKGGYIIAGGTWTIDGGNGMDDHLIAITSEGQVIVYSGTNPASDYVLVGVWDLGEPIGRNCLLKYRGDVLLLLKEGVFPLSSALQSSNTNPAAALTFNIQPTFSSTAFTKSSFYGWQMIHYPAQNMLICNIPRGATESIDQHQYVMNTVTGAWCRFTGIEATCWCIADGVVYFGASTFVGKFWDTEADNGENITADVRHAFSYLGSPGTLKNINAMRPNIISDGEPTITVGVNTDYQDQNITGDLSFAGQTYGLWGQNWGSMIWGGALNFYGQWITSYGLGTAIAPRLRLATKNLEVRYAAVDMLYETGTIIG